MPGKSLKVDIIAEVQAKIDDALSKLNTLENYFKGPITVKVDADIKTALLGLKEIKSFTQDIQLNASKMGKAFADNKGLQKLKKDAKELGYREFQSVEDSLMRITGATNNIADAFGKIDFGNINVSGINELKTSFEGLGATIKTISDNIEGFKNIRPTNRIKEDLKKAREEYELYESKTTVPTSSRKDYSWDRYLSFYDRSKKDKNGNFVLMSNEKEKEAAKAAIKDLNSLLAKGVHPETGIAVKYQDKEKGYRTWGSFTIKALMEDIINSYKGDKEFNDFLKFNDILPSVLTAGQEIKTPFKELQRRRDEAKKNVEAYEKELTLAERFGGDKFNLESSIDVSGLRDVVEILGNINTSLDGIQQSFNAAFNIDTSNVEKAKEEIEETAKATEKANAAKKEGEKEKPLERETKKEASELERFKKEYNEQLEAKNRLNNALKEIRKGTKKTSVNKMLDDPKKYISDFNEAVQKYSDYEKLVGSQDYDPIKALNLKAVAQSYSSVYSKFLDNYKDVNVLGVLKEGITKDADEFLNNYFGLKKDDYDNLGNKMSMELNAREALGMGFDEGSDFEIENLKEEIEAQEKLNQAKKEEVQIDKEKQAESKSTSDKEVTDAKERLETEEKINQERKEARAEISKPLETSEDSGRGISGIDDEIEALNRLTSAANEAAEAKREVVNANGELGSAASESIGSLGKEAEKLDEIKENAEKASKSKKEEADATKEANKEEEKSKKKGSHVNGEPWSESDLDERTISQGGRLSNDSFSYTVARGVAQKEKVRVRYDEESGEYKSTSSLSTDYKKLADEIIKADTAIIKLRDDIKKGEEKGHEVDAEVKQLARAKKERAELFKEWNHYQNDEDYISSDANREQLVRERARNAKIQREEIAFKEQKERNKQRDQDAAKERRRQEQEEERARRRREQEAEKARQAQEKEDAENEAKRKQEEEDKENAPKIAAEKAKAEEVANAKADLKEMLDLQDRLYKHEKEYSKINKDNAYNKEDAERVEGLIREDQEAIAKVASNIQGYSKDSVAAAKEELGYREQIANKTRETVENVEKNELANKVTTQKSIDSQLERYDNFLKKTHESGKYTNAYDEEVMALQKRISKFQEGFSGNGNKLTSGLRDELKGIQEKFNNINFGKTFERNKKAAEKSLEGLKAKIEKTMDINSAMGKEKMAEYENIKIKLDTTESMEELNKLISQMRKLDGEVAKSGKTGKSFGAGLVDRIKSISQSAIAMSFSLYDVIRYGKEMASTVVEVDTAMTELAKVSDASDVRLDESFEKSTETAKELGATITDVISSTADWSRLGYGVDEAEKLAKITTLYQNIGDDITQEEASQSLVSTLQGFQLNTDEAEDVIDKFNEVSNNYAIDSKGIGQALQRSAASFNAANTDLSKSIALITAANEVVQDPEKVGESCAN